MMCALKEMFNLTQQNCWSAAHMRTKIFSGYCPPFPSNHVEDQAKKYSRKGIWLNEKEKRKEGAQILQCKSLRFKI